MKTKCVIRWPLLSAGLTWIVATTLGLLWLLRFQMTPGTASAAASHWPGATEITLANDRPTLMMFLHPQCSCSYASVEELARVLTICPDQTAVHLFFFAPSEQGGNWPKTGLWTSAAALPGATIHTDLDGQLSKQFGATTSGQVFLYAPDGKMLFSGGITLGRDHIGDNTNADLLIHAIGHPDEIHTGSSSPVFGCGIITTTTQPSEAQP